MHPASWISTVSSDLIQSACMSSEEWGGPKPDWLRNRSRVITLTYQLFCSDNSIVTNWLIFRLRFSACGFSSIPIDQNLKDLLMLSSFLCRQHCVACIGHWTSGSMVVSIYTSAGCVISENHYILGPTGGIRLEMNRRWIRVCKYFRHTNSD